MPLVFRRSTSLVFHKTEDCVQLTKKHHRELSPVAKVELAEISRPRPCKTCYPDAPRANVARRWCPECNHSRPRPCAHNGGVKVTMAYETSYISLLRDPGEEAVRTIWVWPEQAHFYEPGLAV